MEGKHIKINGKSIYVCVKGEGEPIIFLHGGPGGSHEYFLPHMEPLAEDYQIILYDQTGCGKSGIFEINKTVGKWGFFSRQAQALKTKYDVNTGFIRALLVMRIALYFCLK